MSRTGRYVAYTVLSGGQPTVNVYDAQTGTHTTLVEGTAPDFSPVADVVAFIRFEPGSPGFYISSINVDGSGLKNWVAGTDVSLSPEWAPDGQSLLYTGSEGTPSPVGATLTRRSVSRTSSRQPKPTPSSRPAVSVS